MKKYIVIIFCLAGNLLFAHTINYGNLILKHWTIERENKTFDGSFYMYKDGNVFIEDAHNKIINYPLTSFSKEDQIYALKKIEWVKELNKNLISQNVKPVETQSPFDFRFLIVAIILSVLGWYFLKVADKKKLKYLVPILGVGVMMTLLSFTGRVIQRLQSTTDPLFIDSAFTPFKPNVYTHWDGTYFYVESKGIPTTHQMMVGISNHGWQQQVPIPQCYTGANAWPIPLNPVISSNPIPVDTIHFTRGAIALAANGVPIFNVHTNTGVNSYLDGQLDNYGGHCGRADDYHYHIAPLHLYNYTSTTLPCAFALDGFAVYGSVEPDGSPMQPLDVNHGHYGTNGVYHYHGTSTYPYMIGKMAGQVTEDSTHQLIPQAAAHPVRPSLTPLNGALITNCLPNPSNNGYTLTYTLNGATDSIVYKWTTSGVYTFDFYTATGHTTQTYNGFVQCSVPASVNEIESMDNSVIIFPNPTDDGFSLQLGKDIQEKDVQEISIYNFNGDLIYKTKQYKQNAGFRNVVQGTYLLKIQLPNHQIIKKLVVR